jgi:uncharacterized protein involved in exopolysaccharide biosynthesis
VETRIGQVSAELAASDAGIVSLQNELHRLPQPLVRQLLGGTPSDGLGRMREELFRLRAREKELLARHTEEHPLAIAIRSQVRDVDQVLRLEQPDQELTIAAVLANARARRDSLVASRESLLAQHDTLSRSLETLNNQEVEVCEAIREVQQLETKYLAHLEHSEQARLDRELQADRISNVNIMQPASLVPAPVRPRKKFTLALALLFGTCGGIALAYVSEHWERIAPLQRGTH